MNGARALAASWLEFEEERDLERTVANAAGDEVGLGFGDHRVNRRLRREGAGRIGRGADNA